MKCKCGNELFKIQNNLSCIDCENNGVYTEDGYVYHQNIVDRELQRTEVNDEGKCRLGTSFGQGCYIFICAKCDHKTNIPLLDN